MAELLIKAIDATLPGPEQDKWAWKRGDVVDIRSDGYHWGSKEGPPMFAVVVVPDATMDELEILRDQPWIAGAEGPEYTGRRKHKLHLDDLQKKDVDDLKIKKITVSKNDLKKIAKNKETGDFVL